MKMSEFVSISTNPLTQPASIMPEALVCIRFHEHDSEFSVTGSESNRTLLGCDRMGDLWNKSEPEKYPELCDAFMSNWTGILMEIFQSSCGIQVLRLFIEQMKALPSISLVLLIKCSVSGQCMHDGQWMYKKGI